MHQTDEVTFPHVISNLGITFYYLATTLMSKLLTHLYLYLYHESSLPLGTQ